MYDLIFPAILLALWAGIRVTLPSVAVDFDFDNAHATFTMLLERYLCIARYLVAIDLALAWWYREPNKMPAHCCLAGAVCGILFCVWLTISYESYLQVRYPRFGGGSLGPSNYTASKRAVTLALGWGMVVFTVVGVVAVLR